MTQLEVDARGLLVACPSCGQTNRLTFGRLGEHVRCGRCKTALRVPSEPLDIASSADFDRIVAESSLPIVVDYWAPWCGPCRMVAPELARVASRAAGQWLVVKVNTDLLDELGARFNVRSIPTMAVFSGGREVGRTAGARPAAEIEAFVQDTLSRAAS